MNKDMVLDFVAGGVSAAVSKTVVAPLERVKLLLQIQVGGGPGVDGACVPLFRRSLERYLIELLIRSSCTFDDVMVSKFYHRETNFIIM